MHKHFEPRQQLSHMHKHLFRVDQTLDPSSLTIRLSNFDLMFKLVSRHRLDAVSPETKYHSAMDSANRNRTLSPGLPRDLGINYYYYQKSAVQPIAVSDVDVSVTP